MCSTEGAGLTSLGGGDYDGDDVAVTLHEDLVKFLEATEGAVRTLKERCPVQANVPEEDAKSWQKPARCDEYIEHVCSVFQDIIPFPKKHMFATECSV